MFSLTRRIKIYACVHVHLEVMTVQKGSAEGRWEVERIAYMWQEGRGGNETEERREMAGAEERMTGNDCEQPLSQPVRQASIQTYTLAYQMLIS